MYSIFYGGRILTRLMSDMTDTELQPMRLEFANSSFKIRKTMRVPYRMRLEKKLQQIKGHNF